MLMINTLSGSLLASASFSQWRNMSATWDTTIFPNSMTSDFRTMRKTIIRVSMGSSCLTIFFSFLAASRFRRPPLSFTSSLMRRKTSELIQRIFCPASRGINL
eukprot:1332187-Amorphochlora_amoeboformis.AAC.2